jgi:hypothetical protein
VNWNDLNEGDKEKYKKVSAFIKDKIVVKEVLKRAKFKPKFVKDKVIEKTHKPFSYGIHRQLYTIFGIRPVKGSKQEKDDTITKYCQYDEAHNDYLYTQEWIDFIVKLLNSEKLPIWRIKNTYRTKRKLDIKEYAKPT